MKRERIISALLAVVLVLSLAACGGNPAPDGTPGAAAAFPGTPDAGMVTLNVTSEPLALNPMLLRDSIAQSILYHCMAGFTKLDANDQPVADLAEDWEMSQDNTVFTMHLRQDAKWSNGDPVTAHDFYYSWMTQMMPETGTVYAALLYDNIKNGKDFYDGKVEADQVGLTVIDDYTLKIEWSRPMPSGLFFLSQPFFLPMNQRAYEEIGAEEYAMESDLIVTNGAYRITEWVHDDHITMEKFEDYPAAAEIQIPKVKLVMIGDANTALNAFIAGELDLSGVYSEQIARLEEIEAGAVQAYVDGASWYLDFNVQDAQLSNANLRKALAYGVDVQSLLDYVINDGSVAADGLVPSTIAGADGKRFAELRGSLFAYDKDAAAAYLDKALEELGTDRAGLKLSFYCTDTTYNKNQAAYLQQQWKENLGLDVALKSMPVQALTEAKVSGEYTFTVSGWGPTENDAITFLENFATGHANNFGGYSNPRYDELIAASAGETDVAARQALLVQAEEQLLEDQVVGPLYFTCTSYAVSDKLVGVVRTPFQYFNVCSASLAA